MPFAPLDQVLKVDSCKKSAFEDGSLTLPNGCITLEFNVSQADSNVFFTNLSMDIFAEKTSSQQVGHVLDLKVFISSRLSASFVLFLACDLFRHKDSKLIESFQVGARMYMQSLARELTEFDHGLQELFHGLNPTVCDLQAVLEIGCHFFIEVEVLQELRLKRDSSLRDCIVEKNAE